MSSALDAPLSSALRTPLTLSANVSTIPLATSSNKNLTKKRLALRGLRCFRALALPQALGEALLWGGTGTPRLRKQSRECGFDSRPLHLPAPPPQANPGCAEQAVRGLLRDSRAPWTKLNSPSLLRGASDAARKYAPRGRRGRPVTLCAGGCSPTTKQGNPPSRAKPPRRALGGRNAGRTRQRRRLWSPPCNARGKSARGAFNPAHLRAG